MASFPFQGAAGLPLPADERHDNDVIVYVLTKKNTVKGKAARLSDSLGRIVDAPREANLVKLCDRIDTLPDSVDRIGGSQKGYPGGEVIDKLSVYASLFGNDAALDILVRIRNADLKKL